MIQETEEIKSMLHNIIQMTNIIKDDFQKMEKHIVSIF